VKCPQCGSQLEVPDDAAGKKAACPDCGTVIAVPRPPSDDEAADILLEGDPDRAIAATPAGTAAVPTPPPEKETALPPTRRRKSIGEPSLLKPARNGPARLASAFALLSLIPGVALLFGPIAVLLGLVGLLVGRSRGMARGTRDVVAAIGVGLLTAAGNWGLILYAVSVLGLPEPIERSFGVLRPQPLPERPIIGGGPANIPGPLAEKPKPDPARRKSLQVWERHIEAAAFSADGKRVVVRDFDKLEICDPENDQRRRIDAGQGRLVTLSPDGRWVVVGEDGAHSELRVYDAETGQHLKTLPIGGFALFVQSRLIFTPDGSLLALSTDYGVYLWRTAGWEKLKTGIQQQFFAARSLAVSPDGSTLAYAVDRPFAPDGTVHLWDARQGKEKGGLGGQDQRLDGLAFAPDGKRLAAAGADNVKVWDVATGAVVWSIERDPSDATLAYSGDGRLLASRAPDGALVLSDAATGKCLAALSRGSHDRFLAVQFGGDGGALLIASEWGLVEVWDVAALLKRGPRR
jgi:DNA-directed RNA polymerase subunit RPC12/RpoP